MSSESSSSAGCGCFGCLIWILGFWFFILFFRGACAADPSGTGIEHDLQQGLDNMVAPIRKAWDGGETK